MSEDIFEMRLGDAIALLVFIASHVAAVAFVLWLLGAWKP